MNDLLTKGSIQYIISRLLDYANEAIKESKKNEQDLFYKGKKLAYIEMLNVLKNELGARDEDLKEYGLDFNIENKLL
ncbi:MAG: transposase [Tissierellia bacterium]|nr:transposase [Tissierellia bacterium]